MDVAAAKERPAASLEAPGFLETPLLRASQLPGIGLEALVVSAARRKDALSFMALCRSLANSRGPTAAAAELQAAHALHWAAFFGAEVIIDYLVDELGCSPFHQEESSLETPIYFAIKAANFRTVRCLLAKGGCRLLQHQNRNSMTPFIVAAAEYAEENIGDALRILELLYLHGVALEEQEDTGQTALMWAARRGCLPIIQWLLSKGANLNHRDHMGRTVLHAAVAGSANEDCVLFLCRKGGVRLVAAAAWGSGSSAGPHTVVDFCVAHRMYLMAGLFQVITFQYKLLGRIVCLKSIYGLLYWCLSLLTLPVLLVMATLLLTSSSKSNMGLYLLHAVLALGLWVSTQVLWLATFKTDPGIVPGSLNRIRDQFTSTDPRFSREVLEVLRWPLGPSYGAYHSQLEHIERRLLLVNLDLCGLNAAVGLRMQRGGDEGGVGVTQEEDIQYQALASLLSALREEACAIQEGLAGERQRRMNEVYVRSLLHGDAEQLKQICVTCTVVKPTRVHHCAECAHCLLRQDHHCVWVDNCIAAGNMRQFWLFLLSLCLCVSESYALTALFVAEAIAVPSQWLWLLLSLCLGVSNAAWLGFSAYLLVRTTRAMLTNVTYFEYLKKPAHIVRRFAGNTRGWLWDFRDLTLPDLIRNTYRFWRNSHLLDQVYVQPLSSTLRNDNPTPSSLWSRGRVLFLSVDELPSRDVLSAEDFFA
ncbi:hypothetical protein Esti_003569 [Eimeria stiedai]